MYLYGVGVKQDEVEALAWFYLIEKINGDKPPAGMTTHRISNLEKKLGDKAIQSAKQRARELDKKIESNKPKP